MRLGDLTFLHLDPGDGERFAVDGLAEIGRADRVILDVLQIVKVHNASCRRRNAKGRHPVFGATAFCLTALVRAGPRRAGDDPHQ
jgi:hypothetical protein